jgi:hypothetical protein
MDEMLTPTDDPSEVERRLAMPLGEAMVSQRAIRRVESDPVDGRTPRRVESSSFH